MPAHKKPTAVKIAEGNRGKFGKAKLNPADEPKPKKEIPKCPSFLSDEAKKEWKRLSEHLYDCGLLTTVDGNQLALLCQAWGRWVEAEKRLEEEDLLVPKDNGRGGMTTNPLLAVAQSEMDRLLKLLTSFGMTPAARSGMSVKKPEDSEKDLWAQFVEKTRIRKQKADAKN